MSLINNIIKALSKRILTPLELTVTASATDAVIHKKIFGSNTTLAFSNENLNDIMKKNKSLEEPCLLIK